MSALGILRACELPLAKRQLAWLIEGLWSRGAVGILGGEPKSCKTFLALEVAVAVATGSACLGTYPVPRAGRVLLYAAEDSLIDVRRRLEGLCSRTGTPLEDLEVHVITEPVLRVDLEEDRRRLQEAVKRIRPSLVILDPFVRLHRVDENVSAQVVPLLAFLRELQRDHDTAVLVVHHARKGAGRARQGQALRGTSEFHGWGDSNLYLRRSGDHLLVLDVEHRAAPSTSGTLLALRQHGATAYLEMAVGEQVLQEKATDAPSPEDRIRKVLEDTADPMPFLALRKAVGMKATTFSQALRGLQDTGLVEKEKEGYQLVI
jgi:DNA-binding transcriptional ArsR family regulator